MAAATCNGVSFCLARIVVTGDWGLHVIVSLAAFLCAHTANQLQPTEQSDWARSLRMDQQAEHPPTPASISLPGPGPRCTS